MKTMMKVTTLILASLMMFVSAFSYADRIENVVVSLGDDLTSQQKQEMIDKFGADKNATVISVTNREERKYLGSYVSEDLIGTRAISCSYVEELADGSGIQVETSNVSWVNPEMIQNALVTAGVKDAKVKISAPFKVSGTAALTGVLKAFEKATGNKVSEKEKQVANEEIAKTGELGQEIGQDEATNLVREVKEVIVEDKIKSPQEIKEVITEKAQELNITLNEDQFNKIISLMENIGSLDLDLSGIKSQLGEITSKVTDAIQNSEEAKGILQKILDFLKELANKIFGEN